MLQTFTEKWNVQQDKASQHPSHCSVGLCVPVSPEETSHQEIAFLKPKKKENSRCVLTVLNVENIGDTTFFGTAFISNVCRQIC